MTTTRERQYQHDRWFLPCVRVVDPAYEQTRFFLPKYEVYHDRVAGRTAGRANSALLCELFLQVVLRNNVALEARVMNPQLSEMSSC